MSKYRITISVCAQVEEFRSLVNQIPDKKLLTIYNNFDNPAIEEICKELELQGSRIVRNPYNPGCAWSFNRSLDEILEFDLDYIVALSPSCIFNNSVLDFVEKVDEEEAKASNYFYWAPSIEHGTDMHCIAITKKCLNEVGYYDENFTPYSFEDTDYGYRMKLLGAWKNRIELNRHSHPTAGGVTKDPRLMLHYQRNATHIHDYYVRKWGGEHTQETFTRPFNNPEIDINQWYREEFDICPLE